MWFMRYCEILGDCGVGEMNNVIKIIYKKIKIWNLVIYII